MKEINYPFRYPKIQTLWMRDTIRKVKRKGLILLGQFSKLEFDNIKRYDITEKLDGENTRVHINFDKINGLTKDFIWFGGRNDNAQMNKELVKYLKLKLTETTIFSAFAHSNEDKNPYNIMLFGEGYGNGIIHGGEYSDTPTFALFDVVIDGWWLDRKDVQDIANKLGLKTVFSYGFKTIEEAIEIVKSKPYSLSAQHLRKIEGIVARTSPQMLFKNGDPIMWKLKVSDYINLENYNK